MGEGDERLPRGPQGERGEQGAQGVQGRRGEQLSPALRRALVYMFLLAVLLAVLAFVAEIHEQNTSRAAQQRQGRLIERKLCTTLDRLTELRPPPGNPATNPSRKFDQELHETLSQLGPDLGCR
jgi:hypothetical protein